MDTISIIDSPQARAYRAQERLSITEERMVGAALAADVRRSIAYAAATCYEDKIAADAVYFSVTAPLVSAYDAALKEVRG